MPTLPENTRHRSEILPLPNKNIKIKNHKSKCLGKKTLFFAHILLNICISKSIYCRFYVRFQYLAPRFTWGVTKLVE
jgi:hypothetical protein